MPKKDWQSILRFSELGKSVNSSAHLYREDNNENYMNIINLDSNIKLTEESSFTRIYHDSMTTDKFAMSSKNGNFLMTNYSGSIDSRKDFTKKTHFRVEHINLDPIDLESKATIS